MNEKNFDMALGHVDADLVEAHLSERTARTAERRSPRRALAVAAAACVAVVVLGGAGIALSRTGGALGDIFPGEDETSSPGHSESLLAPLRIYYLAADGSVQSEVQNLPANDPETVLVAWREMNGLSEAEAEAVLSCMELVESEETVDGETRQVYHLSINAEDGSHEEAELGYTYFETVRDVAQYRVIEWATGDDGDRVITSSGDWGAFVDQLIEEMNKVVVETETDESGRVIRETKYRPYDGSKTVIEYDEQGRVSCSVSFYSPAADNGIRIPDFFVLRPPAATEPRDGKTVEP